MQDDQNVWRMLQPAARKAGPHYLDYFHGQLYLSPGGSNLLDDGWVWHPSGMPVTWDVRRWFGGNVWE